MTDVPAAPTDLLWALDGPLESFKDAARHLRRPFTPEAVKFKVQWQNSKTNPTVCGVIVYIDARLVIERLNLLVPHLWFAEYEILQGGKAWCHLTIRDQADRGFDITRRDVGEGQGKALISDSLKRAAVHFGVAVSVYAVPQAVIGIAKQAALLEKKGSGDKTRLELTPQGVATMRLRYAQWLERIGVAAFGPPLDHGDTANDEAQAGEQVEHEPPTVQTGVGNLDARAAAVEAQDAAAEATQAPPEPAESPADATSTPPPPSGTHPEVRALEERLFGLWERVGENHKVIFKKIEQAGGNPRILQIQIEAAERRLEQAAKKGS